MKNDSGTFESAEMLSDAIREIVAKIKTSSDANPVELEAIKKLIRKNVPFTMRGAFSAYILRALMTKPAPSSRRPNDRKKEDRRKKEAPEARKPQPQKEEARKAERPAPAKKAEKPAREEREQRPAREPREAREPRQEREPREQREIPEGAKTLYVSVGRMKHLYPKQLSEIFQEELGITRDDIYAIRIHDKYSFITLSEENCEKAIEKITGKNINGRVATVSYSRLENKDKAEEAPAAPAAAPVAAEEAAPAPAPVAEEAPAPAVETPVAETAAPAEEN